MKKILLVFLLLASPVTVSAAPAYVIGNSNGCTAISCAVTLTNTNTGNLIVLGLFVGDSTVSVSSVTDTQGNTYTLIGSAQTWSPHNFVERLYYAKNIKGGADTTTVTLSGSKYMEIYQYAYSGLDISAPLDVSAPAKTGTAVTTGTSGTLTTTNANDLLFGFFHSDNGVTNTPGPGFTGRTISVYPLAEDMNVTSIGSYSATMGFSASADYVGFFVAFKASSVPSANLQWTDPVNPAGSVTYSVYRATAASCTPLPTFTKIASGITGLTYADSTIAPATGYCYRITAVTTAAPTTESLPCQAVYLPGSISTCSCQ